MRLKRVWISDYKNLKDFTFEFKEDNFLEIFVGKNASGKSNLFEAIALIFKHLSEFRQGESTPIEFDYEIEYLLGEKDLLFSSKSGKIHSQNIENNTSIQSSLPDKIIFYYSGHSQSAEAILSESYKFLQRTYQDAELDRRDALKADSDSPGFERDFDYIFSDMRLFGIDATDINIILLAILLQKKDLTTKAYLLNHLGIKNLESVLHLTLKKPFYTHSINNRHNGSRRYDGSITFGSTYSSDPPIDRLDEETHFWSLRGKLKEFLKLFVEANLDDSVIRTEGYQEEKEEWSIYSDMQKLKDKLSIYSPFEIFEAFSSLRLLGMFKSLSFDLQLNSGEVINSKGFSDGQLQSLYIFALTEIFKDQQTLMLLDEPDSFLHPEWQYQFLDQIREISDEAQQGNHILMSSHSAITMINHPAPKPLIYYIDTNDKGMSEISLIEKRKAVENLSGQLLEHAERIHLLSIVNNIQLNDKPIFLTEGITDSFIIKEAWYKLYQDEIMPFHLLFAFGHRFMGHLLKDDGLAKEMEGQIFFALFDFDEAYNSWNGVKGDLIKDDPYKGYIKQFTGNSKIDAYLILMPVPDTDQIKKQVIKTDGSTFKQNSLCEIEHLFYHEESDHFRNEEAAAGNLIKLCTNKIQFAKNYIPTLDKSSFEIFRPMFEFIKSKCGNRDI